MSLRRDEMLLEENGRDLIERSVALGHTAPASQAGRRARFNAMLDIIDGATESPVVLCDFGCGTGDLLAHIRRRGLRNITYVGADRSVQALAVARVRFPDATFVNIDINVPGDSLDAIACDYLVASDLFTLRHGLSYGEMWPFVVAAIERLWPKVRRGLAFNAISKMALRERGDVFRLPMDDAARLLRRLAGPRVRIRADYDLSEYTALAYRDAPPGQAPTARVPRVQGQAERKASVPVLRPLLPAADRLLPYLRRIDAARIYTNYGPLVCELEQRLAEHLAVPAGGVASASSGTAALTGTILAVAGRATSARPLALMPAFTFVATAAAAEQCGYQPYLADIDPETWMLDPGRLAEHPALAEVGVVIPVAPFGRPVPQGPWRAFRDRTGIPVVIDGAAMFDVGRAPPGYSFGAIPVALSLHATKGYGTGEGGAVVWADADRLRRVAQVLNFGFYDTRDSRTPSTNGKMSEYHAAVGLAGLDDWTERRTAFLAVAERYRRGMADAGLGDRFFAAPDIGFSYALFQCRSGAEAVRVQEAFQRGCVGWRLWYGGGLHHQSHFAALPRERLDTTDEMAPALLGLPMAPDLGEEQIARVIGTLAAALRRLERAGSRPAL
jgi:dTDP-4-amino-4,6-dideoxygalactose transaminase/SAM-dependent methyltransferase